MFPPEVTVAHGNVVWQLPHDNLQTQDPKKIVTNKLNKILYNKIYLVILIHNQTGGQTN